MRLIRVVAIVAASAAPLAAQTGSSGATDRGSMLVSGSASLSRINQSSDEELGLPEQHTTSVYVQPSVLYFVARRVAVGGQLGVSYASFEQGHASSWMVGPAARAFFGASDAKVLPFVGGAIVAGSSTFKRDTPTAGTSESSTWGLEGVGGLTLMLSRQVGVTGEGFVTRTEEKLQNSALSDRTLTRTEFGVRFGISAFLF